MTAAITSRIGRKPVAVPAGVEVKLQNRTVSLKGPKGQLSVELHPFVDLDIDKSEIKIVLNSTQNKGVTGSLKKVNRAIAGTTRSLISSAIHGVAQGFECKLLLVGVGYRAQAKGKVLSLSLGFSHPTEYKVPEGVTIETPSQTEIIVKGANKELVGLVAAQVRSIRSPEPYKGKGVRYADEVIEIKETKKK